MLAFLLSKAIRDGLCLMKKYIVQCRLAKEEGLCEVVRCYGDDDIS